MNAHRLHPKFLLLAHPTHTHAIKSQSAHPLPPPSPSMDSIRNELHSLMLSTNSQSSRQSILQKLIQLLQEEMRKMIESEKQQRRMQEETSDKRTHKLEYDIEQILQKHNEEVAKINQLKEMSASARSDRVVFSNLFKKIEREIKDHEQTYTQLIIRSETMGLSIPPTPALTQQPHQSHRTPPTPHTPTHSPIPHSTHHSQPHKPFQPNLFLTNPHSHQRKRSSSRHNPHPREGSDIRNAIEQVEATMQKLIKVAECSTYEETLRHYAQLQNENRRLSESIELENSRIEETEAEIERLRLERRISEIYEDRQLQKLESLPSMRKVRSNRLIRTVQTEENEENDKEIVEQVAQVLGLGVVVGDELYVEVQSKVERLLGRKSEVSSEVNLDGLLSKMQRFQSCDRILTKAQLEAEYLRQVLRNRRCRMTRK